MKIRVFSFLLKLSAPAIFGAKLKYYRASLIYDKIHNWYSAMFEFFLNLVAGISWHDTQVTPMLHRLFVWDQLRQPILLSRPWNVNFAKLGGLGARTV